MYLRDAFQVLAQDVMEQANREVVVPRKSNVNSVVTRVRDVTKMNPYEFHGSKIE